MACVNAVAILTGDQNLSMIASVFGLFARGLSSNSSPEDKLQQLASEQPSQVDMEQINQEYQKMSSRVDKDKLPNDINNNKNTLMIFNDKNNKPETIKNPDGSKTVTTIDKNGTKTETTYNKNGTIRSKVVYTGEDSKTVTDYSYSKYGILATTTEQTYSSQYGWLINNTDIKGYNNLKDLKNNKVNFTIANNAMLYPGSNSTIVNGDLLLMGLAKYLDIGQNNPYKPSNRTLYTYLIFEPWDLVNNRNDNVNRLANTRFSFTDANGESHNYGAHHFGNVIAGYVASYMGISKAEINTGGYFQQGLEGLRYGKWTGSHEVTVDRPLINQGWQRALLDFPR